MTNQEIYDLFETVEIYRKLSKIADDLGELLYNYPHFKDKTLYEVKDYFENRAIQTKREIEENLKK